MEEQQQDDDETDGDATQNNHDQSDRLSNRVVVKGLVDKQQDLNDRTGTIRYWDSSKGKFMVGLDTKRGHNVSCVLFAPGNLEPLRRQHNHKQVSRQHQWQSERVACITVENFYQGQTLEVDVYKSEMVQLTKAQSPRIVLQSLMAARTREEERQKEAEAYFKAQEAEARRRYEEYRRQEQEEYDAQKKAYQAYKKAWEERRKQQRQERYYDEQRAYEKFYRGYFADDYDFFGGGGGGGAHHRYGCQCLRCRISAFFNNPGSHYHFGASHSFGDDDDDDDFNYFYSNDSDDDDYDDEDNSQWDRQWRSMRQGKRQEAADTLGVDIHASAAEIKRVYRRKALQYHPDRFRAEDFDDGTTKEKAEEHMQALNNAYAVLTSD